jgi:hypothetical protein
VHVILGVCYTVPLMIDPIVSSDYINSMQELDFPTQAAEDVGCYA